MVNSLMLLAVEANGVIALWMMKLMRGGRSTRREAELMVSEKIHGADGSSSMGFRLASLSRTPLVPSTACGVELS